MGNNSFSPSRTKPLMYRFPPLKVVIQQTSNTCNVMDVMYGWMRSRIPGKHKVQIKKKEKMKIRNIDYQLYVLVTKAYQTCDLLHFIILSFAGFYNIKLSIFLTVENNHPIGQLSLAAAET